MPRVGLRAYARHRDVTLRAVQKAIADGRIERGPDGKIDQDEADRRWKRTTDPSKPRNSIGTGRPKRRRKPGTPSLPLGHDDAPGATNPSAAAGAVQGGPDPGGSSANGDAAHLESYAMWRARREKALAETAQLELQRSRGRLVDAEQMRLVTFQASRRARDVLLAMADRLAPVLVGLEDELQVHELLRDHVRQTLDELARGLEPIGTPALEDLPDLPKRNKRTKRNKAPARRPRASRQRKGKGRR